MDEPLELVEDVFASRHPLGANLVISQDTDVLLGEIGAEQENFHDCSVINAAY